MAKLESILLYDLEEDIGTTEDIVVQTSGATTVKIKAIGSGSAIFMCSDDDVVYESRFLVNMSTGGMKKEGEIDEEGDYFTVVMDSSFFKVTSVSGFTKVTATLN